MTLLPERGNGSRKVCVLTSVHSPEDVRIFHKEAVSLAAAGYEVTIVAPHPNDISLGAVQVKSVPLPKARSDRMLRTVWSVFQAGRREAAFAYHLHDPELLPVGLLLKLSGRRVIYDVHEDVPRDILDKDWIPRWLRKPIAMLAGFIEIAAASKFDAVVAATPSIARRFPPEKTCVLQNFSILGELDVAGGGLGVACGKENMFVYVGGISEIRGIRQMIAALHLLSPSLRARCAIAGRFDSAKLEKEVSCLAGWSSTNYLGWQSRTQVATLLAQVRVGLLLFQPVANHTESVPTKLFEYMSAGLPVIASDFPLWREIVEETGCGLLVDPTKPKAIAEGMEWMLTHIVEADNMGRRGAEAVRTCYNWNREEKKLLELYARLERRSEQRMPIALGLGNSAKEGK